MKKHVNKLTLSRETLINLTSTSLTQVVAGTCWETIALPCNDQGDSANGCVSGNLCGGYGAGIDPNG